MAFHMFTQIAEVTPNLYLCCAAALKQTERIRRLGIRTIINCTIECPNVRIPGIEVIQLHCGDHPSASLCVHFDTCAAKIQQVAAKGGKTLVHCMAGVSRSAAICIAYLMKYNNMSLAKAYELLKCKRSVVRPNVGFIRQLIDYEQQLFGTTTVNFVESSMGPVPSVYEADVRGMVFMPRNLNYVHSSLRD